jgi:uncharacterized protein YkwD
MSAKPEGRALFYIAAIILLIVAMPSVLASSGLAPAGDGQTSRPPTGDFPTTSHRHQPDQKGGAPSTGAPPKPKDEFLYLPVVAMPQICHLNAEEEALAALAVGDPDQEREYMRCNPILSLVAREHAEDMASRDYFGIVNPEGFGPNYLVEQAGYQLPVWYDQEPGANNIASMAAGYATPEGAWNSWLDENGHQEHVLGEIDYFAEQTHYGIGYAYNPDSQYTHYWVFITAPPAGT